MSLLTLVQNAAQRIGIPSPAAVASSSDTQVLQLMALASEEGQELAERYQWQALTAEATFTTLAVESQGAVATIAPGIKYIVNDTIWNRTYRRPVFGPRSSQSWQQMKAMQLNGPFNQFVIQQGLIKFTPVPAAGQLCYFNYVTKNWATDVTGVTGKSSFSADSDVSLLDEDILLMGLIWRWKAAKGFNYAEDYNKYERRVADYATRDGSKTVLNMGDNAYDIFPAVVVPAGSWNL